MTDVKPLQGRRIALLETREAERLAGMLRREGAEVVSCPTIRIVDPDDPAPVRAWLNRFVARPSDDLILMTGEGVSRLYAAAEADGSAPGFLDALRRTRTVTRGPKPARGLRALGLQPGLRATDPTTEGIIALLSQEELGGRRIGVQLYPAAPDRLIQFLTGAGVEPDPVTPYQYVPYGSDEALIAAIDRIVAGGIDAVAFTSAAQVRRLFEVASKAERTDALRAALRQLAIASIGPVVAAELCRYGVSATVTPQDAFFMKPLVNALSAAFSPEP